MYACLKVFRTYFSPYSNRIQQLLILHMNITRHANLVVIKKFCSRKDITTIYVYYIVVLSLREKTHNILYDVTNSFNCYHINVCNTQLHFLYNSVFTFQIILYKV